MKHCAKPLMISLAVSAVYAAPSHAEDYTVQIGVFKSSNAAYVATAQSLDTVYKNLNDNGFTVYTVGSFETRSQASALKGQLMDSGYSDAFVRSTEPSTSLTADTTTTNTIKTPINASFRPSSLSDEQMLSKLSEVERENVVYLDGTLHLKQGETFTPVSTLINAR